MRYAILDADRKIINIIEVSQENAAMFSGHYVGDSALGLGDTYPEEDIPIPEPTEPPAKPTETDILRSQIADLQSQLLTLMSGG